MGGVVRAPVLGEEEGRNRCGPGIVCRGDIVFEKVEDSECEQEERRAPERGLLLKGKENAGQGDAEGETEEEGAQRNGGGGFRVWTRDLGWSR